jgi:hypothetical protein
MQSQSDTPPLDRLAADLGLEKTSPDFRHVLEHLRAEAWTETDIANDYREALRAAKVRWNVIQRWAGRRPAGKRRARGMSSWRDYAAALERRAADIARQDGAVQAFRRDVLNGSVVSPNHADAQAWLRAHRQHHNRLTGLARALADAHGWLPNDALVFVLTDVTPPRPPLSGCRCSYRSAGPVRRESRSKRNRGCRRMKSPGPSGTSGSACRGGPDTNNHGVHGH